jgi:16S rRNA (cytosine1407-C5)-methyltransferase
LALLISALKAAKIGGEVVYSTCTMAPEENESVVNALLKLYPQSVSIAEPFIQDPRSKGFTHFQDQQYHPTLQNTMRVWPHLYATNGFFAAKLIKTSQIEINKLAIPQRSFSQTGLIRLKENEAAMLLNQLFERFGFSPNHFNDFEIYQRESQLFLIPKAYLQHFQTLPYNTLGMPLGKLIKGHLEPGFEFVMRFGDQFESNVWQMPPEFQSTWLQGHDLRNLALPDTCKPGIIAIKNENDVLIGAGKWSAQRLRNLLPHRFLR